MLVYKCCYICIMLWHCVCVSVSYCTWEIFKNWRIWQIVSYSPKFSSPIFTDTPKMYLAYTLTVAYLPKFSSPIAFTCAVCQNFLLPNIVLKMYEEKMLASYWLVCFPKMGVALLMSVVNSLSKVTASLDLMYGDTQCKFCVYIGWSNNMADKTMEMRCKQEWHSMDPKRYMGHCHQTLLSCTWASVWGQY